MSAIGGLVRLGARPATEAEVSRALAAMRRRGPKERRTWTDGTAALGHASLGTCGAGVAQPLADPASGRIIVFDGRIDEGAALRSELRARGFDPGRDDDAALALQAHACWGEDAPKHLLGDFAFAIWDARTRTLFAARDAFGVRPFHYAHTDEGFAFASELGALLDAGLARRVVDPVRIVDSFFYELEHLDQERTAAVDVRRLRAAHTLTLRDGRVATRRWWRPEPEPLLRLDGAEAYAEVLRAHLDRAVSRTLRGSGVASMLSGGIDSSAVVGTARTLREEPLPVFSVMGDDPATCPETPFIDAVCAGHDFERHVVKPRDLAPFACDLRAFVEQADDPFVLGILDVVFTMYAAAGREGAHVLLDGMDGDLVLSRGPHPLLSRALGRFDVPGAWRVARTIAGTRGASTPWTFFRHGVAPCLRAVSGVPKRDRSASLRDGARQRIAASLVREDVAASFGLEDRLVRLHEEVHGDRGWPSTRHRHAAQLSGPFLPVALERYDRAASFASVDHRHPLLDRELAELGARIPLEHLVSGGWRKGLLRHALEGRVPDLVRWRTPVPNLSPPVFLRLTDLNREFLETCVRNPTPLVDEVADLGAARGALSDYGATGDWQDANTVWTVVLADLVCRRIESAGA